MTDASLSCTFSEVVEAIARRVALIKYRYRITGREAGFDTQKAKTWLDVKVMPGATLLKEIGAGARPRRTGVIDIDIHGTIGGGMKELYAIADALAGIFEYKEEGRVSFREASLQNKGIDLSTQMSTMTVTVPYYSD